MADPVFTSDGHTYERHAIHEWLFDHDTSPNTGERLRHKEVTPNVMARGLISAWLQEPNPNPNPNPNPKRTRNRNRNRNRNRPQPQP